MNEPAALAPRAGNARPVHVAIAFRTLGWYVLVRLVLATRGFAGARRMLKLSPVDPVEREAGEVDELREDQARSLVWAFRILDGVKASCLPRSIVLDRMLAAEGIAAEIVIGVVTNDGFRAHAWVEVEGRKLRAADQGTEIWKPLARFKSGRGGAR